MYITDKINNLKPIDLNCNVFDVYSYNDLSMQELLCHFFTKINECIKVSNDTIDLSSWLVNEGLAIEVVDKLLEWLNDGTLEELINVNLFKTLNDKIDNVNTKLTDVVNGNINVYYDMFESSHTQAHLKLKEIIDTYPRDKHLTIILPQYIEFTDKCFIPMNVTIKGNNSIVNATTDTTIFEFFNEESDIVSQVTKVISNKEYEVLSAKSFKVGDYVAVYGHNGCCNIYSSITSINGNTITLSNDFDYGVHGSIIYIRKSIDCNNTLEGVTITKATESKSKKEVVLSGISHNKTIRNCHFKSCAGVSVVGMSQAKIQNNTFYDTGDSCFLYDVSSSIIENNKFNYFGHGVRCEYITNTIITNNELINGRSKSYSTGIEISSATMDRYKATYNKILNNTVIDVNVGVAGSAIGGIHLNFNANSNIIKGNICRENGIGIYLENYNKNNIITENNCSYNKGYYGVGIELDWGCSDNIISNNKCNHNYGSTQAKESCGIQVRTSTGEHAIYNVTVIGNECSYNGRHGIIMNANNSVCCDNVLSHNGMDINHDLRSDLSASSSEFITFSNNSIISSTNAIYSVYLDNCKSITFNGNSVKASPSNTHSLLSVNGGIQSYNNNIFFTPTRDRGVVIKGADASNMLNVVSFNDNLLNGSDNGYAILEFDYVTKYQIKNNILLNNTRTVEYQCSNKIS